MPFVGRSRELGLLRGVLDRPTPQVVRVTGLPGVGKSALVRRAVGEYDGIVLVCAPLPAPAQLAAFGDQLAALDGHFATAEWTSFFQQMLDQARAAERPFVLVLDDAHRLTESRARWLEPLEETLRTAASEATAMHIVLVGRESGLPGLEGASAAGGPRAGGARAGGARGGGARGGAGPDDGSGAVGQTLLRLGPLPLRTAAPLLPGSEAHHVVRAYGVFGGIPRVLAQLDTSVTVGTNVRRLVLDLDGPLAEAPAAWLEREVQTPSRYMAILRALAFGEADWGTVHSGVPDLTRSGQVAPYLKRLEELGMIEVRAALDAKQGSRSGRYAITDPFLAFWFRFALPWRHTASAHTEPAPLREHYAEHVRPAIADHMERMMPALARRHMERDALETVGASVRACGSLWGSGYDIPVAGLLSNGAAFYGTSVWAAPERTPSPLDALDAEIRETRYGFGRERRLRLVFTGRAAPTWLRREIARRPDARLVEAKELLGI